MLQYSRMHEYLCFVPRMLLQISLNISNTVGFFDQILSLETPFFGFRTPLSSWKPPSHRFVSVTGIMLWITNLKIKCLPTFQNIHLQRKQMIKSNNVSTNTSNGPYLSK